MRLSKKVLDAVNEQINMELSSSYTYLAMSAYCERISFTGCASWLRVQSQEEKDHAMKLYEFLSNRGAKIVLKAIAAPPVDWKSLLDVFEDSLKNEEKVSDAINGLYELALKEKAFATATELQWFLTEQVEEEKTARDIVAKFRMVGKDPSGLLDLDRHLGSRSQEA